MTEDTTASAASRAENERSIYQAQRAHELELNKATAAFEHAVISPLVLLNGGAIVAFLTLLGAVTKKDSTLAIDIGFALVGVALWALSLTAAMLAVGAGYGSQRTFSRSVSARRRLMERALDVGDDFHSRLAPLAEKSPDDLLDEALELQGRWLLHVRLSQGGFLAGVAAAGAAVAIGAATPEPEPYVIMTKAIAAGLFGVVVVMVAAVVRRQQLRKLSSEKADRQVKRVPQARG